MKYIFIATAFSDNRSRTSNIFESLDDAINSIQNNGFDIWEGYTNIYMVIEKMPFGAPWLLEEVQWYTREVVESESYLNKEGTKCIDRKGYVFEIEKPKKYKGICNFGVG